MKLSPKIKFSQCDSIHGESVLCPLIRNINEPFGRNHKVISSHSPILRIYIYTCTDVLNKKNILDFQVRGGRCSSLLKLVLKGRGVKNLEMSKLREAWVCFCLFSILFRKLHRNDIFSKNCLSESGWLKLRVGVSFLMIMPKKDDEIIIRNLVKITSQGYTCGCSLMFVNNKTDKRETFGIDWGRKHRLHRAISPLPNIWKTWSS